MIDPLPGRTISAFPLSVGTSLAFESIFRSTQPSIDPERKVPQWVDMGDYQEFWVNLSTLFRNMMGALDKTAALTVNYHQLRDALIGEMETIQSLVRNEGGNKTKVIFFVCGYEKLAKSESKFVQLRKDDTVNQKIYRALHDQTLKLILAELHQSDTLRVYDSEIGKPPPNGPSTPTTGKPVALLLTHIAWDLTSFKNFTTLDLIESHTGALKKRPQWYSKYQNGRELVMIPFMEGFLKVFGDSEHFRPMDIRLRKDIIELAQEYRWTQVTTREKVRSNLDQLKNPYYRDILKTVL